MTSSAQANHVHRCLMVYPSGSREEMPRRTGQLSMWLKSNRTFHPAAALFVDGQCEYKGHLSDEEITRIEGENK